MCPYMICFEGSVPKCESSNDICTLCVLGDKKIFNDIENKNGELNNENYLQKSRRTKKYNGILESCV